MKDEYRIEYRIDQRLPYGCLLVLADQMRIVFGGLRAASARRNTLLVQRSLLALHTLIQILANQLRHIAQVRTSKRRAQIMAGTATAAETLIESVVGRSAVQIRLAALELFQLDFRLFLAYWVTLIVFVQL